ncbi:MAG: hypothetical protein Fur0022_33830 [Anaerolineales bacterium]
MDTLIEAAIQGNSNLVRELLQQGVDPNAPDHTGETALTWAAYLGHTGVVKDLLAAGAAREVTGQFLSAPPLLLAAQGGHRGIVALLVVLSDVNARNAHGQTALMLALEPSNNFPKPQPRILKLLETLLHAGAEIDLQDHQGHTALMIAARWGNLEAAQMLVKAGADTRPKNQMGQTAAEIALDAGALSIVRLLE